MRFRTLPCILLALATPALTSASPPSPADFGSGVNYGRCDYDCSGGIGANDLALWLTTFGSGTMAQSCVSSCP